MFHRQPSPQAPPLGSLHAAATALLVAMACMPIHAQAQHLQEHACKVAYHTASQVIRTEVDRRETEYLLLARLDRAWRAFWDGGNLAVANPHLDALEELLSGQAAYGIAPQGKARILQNAAEFRQCIHSAAPIPLASLAVRVFNPDFDRPDGKGSAADDNVYLLMDGLFVAKTDASGQAMLSVPAGSVAIEAIVPSSAITWATVQAHEGATVPVQMILDDGKEVSTPVQLAVSAMVGDVLPSTFDDFTITLFDKGVVRAAAKVGHVSMEDALGNTLATLSDDFRVDAQGRLVPTDLEVVRKVVARYPGKALVLIASAVDALGFSLDGTHPVYWGEYTLDVALAAPPSHPALNVAGIEMAYQLMGTDLILRSTSDASGHLSFGLVPRGPAWLDSQVQQSGRYYYGQAMLPVSRPSRARVTMAHTDDVVNGVARFERLPAPEAAGHSPDPSSEPSAEVQAQRQRRHMQLRLERSHP